MLVERRARILGHIVSEYVHTALPVGSETIVRKYGLPISPATVRNEMARLEEEGYITHPHTSAGRIPSDMGYRFYVESLMEEEDLPWYEKQSIQRRLRMAARAASGRAALLAERARIAATVLAESVRNAAVATAPRSPGIDEEDDALYDRAYLEGLRNVLSQPEFSQTEDVIDLVCVLEEGNLMRAMPLDNLSGEDVTVVIGEENREDVMRRCSVVLTRYGVPGTAVGVLAVLGPTRMAYSRVIPTVRYLSLLMGDSRRPGLSAGQTGAGARMSEQEKNNQHPSHVDKRSSTGGKHHDATENLRHQVDEARKKAHEAIGPEAQLEEERKKAEGYLASWQRTAADFQNYKRRTEQERQELALFANASLIINLLPIVDDLERALQSVDAHLAGLTWVDGIGLIYRKFRAVLEASGVKEIQTEGQDFDPRYHEATMFGEGEDGKVVAEVQKGYMLGDRVLRPAMVVVGRGKPSEQPPEGQAG